MVRVAFLMREGVVRGADLLKLMLSIVVWVAVVARHRLSVCGVADQRSIILVDVSVGLSGTPLGNESRLVRLFWHSWIVMRRLDGVLFGSFCVLGSIVLFVTLLKMCEVRWHRVLADHLGMLSRLVIGSGGCSVMRSGWNASSVGRSLGWVLLLVILLLVVPKVGHIVYHSSVVRRVVDKRRLVNNSSSVDDGGVVNDRLVNNNVVVRLL